MAIIYGAALANMAPVVIAWSRSPSGLAFAPVEAPPALVWLLSAMALGVLASGIRDSIAAARPSRREVGSARAARRLGLDG